MERLEFSGGGTYDGLEASIHLARYAFVRDLCVGQTVLDLACGEGYGTRLMADWGARRVVGVDISREAVERAKALFATPAVDYLVQDAARVPDLFPTERFDLIVSLETIEHVEAPDRLLADFGKLLAPGGVLVVSCPNDWWYYPSAEESNPHHRRKYSFDAFRDFAQGVLGPARAWYLGGPQAGFLNVRMDAIEAADASSTQALMLKTAGVGSAIAIPAELARGPCASAASYFVGVWSTRDELGLGTHAGAALLPVSMDAFRNGFFTQTASPTESQGSGPEILVTEDAALAAMSRRLEILRADLRRCDDPADQADSGVDRLIGEKLRHARWREEACEIEKEILVARLSASEKSEARALQQEILTRQKLVAAQALSGYTAAAEDLQGEVRRLAAVARSLDIEAARYRRLRDMVPASVRRFGLRIFRAIRRVAR